MEWLLPVGLSFLILVVSSVVAALYAVHRACSAEIEVRALKASTHQVQFVPADDLPGVDKEDEMISKQLSKDEQLAWDSLRDVSEPLS